MSLPSVRKVLPIGSVLYLFSAKKSHLPIHPINLDSHLSFYLPPSTAFLGMRGLILDTSSRSNYPRH